MKNIVFSSKDFSLKEIDAVIWGVFAGWDDASFLELKQKFNWSKRDIKEIKKLRSYCLKIIASSSLEKSRDSKAK
jgi:hypothetical protein